jgi:hypothetical protein
MSDIFSSDSWLNMIITEVNDFLWTYILIAVLVFGMAAWLRKRYITEDDPETDRKENRDTCRQCEHEQEVQAE